MAADRNSVASDADTAASGSSRCGPRSSAGKSARDHPCSLHQCRLADGWLFGSLYLMTELIRQRAIEGECRADCVLVAIVELAALTINVEVVLRRFLLVALHSSIRSGPGEGISNFEWYGSNQWFPLLAFGR